MKKEKEYKVVLNHEEQYSIWPEDRANALGWRDAGRSGTKQECLAYIKEVWTDMRPLSLRKKMEEWAQNPPPLEFEEIDEEQPLVDRLSEGEHPLEFVLRPAKSLIGLSERIEMGLVHVKFTDTRGGTELSLRLDRSLSDLNKADFKAGVGFVLLVGNLTLDYVRVQCWATIHLATLAGTGYLRRVPENTSPA